MTFAEFEAQAGQEWERIPEEFKAGVDGLMIVREAKAHPRTPGVYTLGECLTESYPSDYGGPDTTRSEVVLYYGSFRRLAATEPAFDWEAEIWETLTHELRHHLESLAEQDDLGEVDAAMEEHFRRLDELPFDPFYFRDGEPLAPGAYGLEDTYFVETVVEADGFARFGWRGARYRVRVPDGIEDLVFLTVEGVADPPTELCVVAVQPQSLRTRLLAAFRPRRRKVPEAVARAERE